MKDRIYDKIISQGDDFDLNKIFNEIKQEGHDDKIWTHDLNVDEIPYVLKKYLNFYTF